MKKLLALVFVLSLFGQGLHAQKQYVKLVEEKPNRYFLKVFAGNYIRSMENDFDNSAYMDIEVKGDVIDLTVFALDEDNGGYIVSTSVHGSNKDINHKYIKTLNDVYIASEFLGGDRLPDLGRNEAPYILYNSTKGVYFHSYRSENNSGFSTFSPTKAKVKPTEKITNYDLYKSYEKLYQEAIDAHNSEIPKRRIAELQAKKDDGITSDLHKANIKKILFGNSITKENMNTSTAYKSKFTIDEPVMMTIFSDKGFNKYVNPNESDLEKIENINGQRESVFLLKLIFSNGSQASKTTYIQHPEGRYVTVGFQDLVYGKGKSKTSDNNNWIIEKSGLDVITSAVTVTVQLVLFSDEKSVVAEGSYTYTPKPGARMPYGKSCSSSTDVKIKDLARIKAGLTASFKKALLSKEETKNFTLVELIIGSDWQEDNSMPYKYITVYYVVKNASGKCFSGSDRYLWFDPKSLPEIGGYFFHAESKHMSIIDDLYPYCDCK
jgi:hypothetical protein